MRFSSVSFALPGFLVFRPFLFLWNFSCSDPQCNLPVLFGYFIMFFHYSRVSLYLQVSYGFLLVWCYFPWSLLVSILPQLEGHSYYSHPSNILSKHIETSSNQQKGDILKFSNNINKSIFQSSLGYSPFSNNEFVKCRVS